MERIFKIVDNGNGELKLHEKVVLSDSDIPTDEIIKIPSVTIVIKSLLEKDNKFYLETCIKSFILPNYKEMILYLLIEHDWLIYLILSSNSFRKLYI